jgi:hypothetical protein
MKYIKFDHRGDGVIVPMGSFYIEEQTDGAYIGMIGFNVGWIVDKAVYRCIIEQMGIDLK